MELVVRAEEGSYECENWGEFLATWDAYSDKFAIRAVCSPNFMLWLKQAKPKKCDLIRSVFGDDVSKWPNDLLLKVLKSGGSEAEVVEWKAVVEERKGPKPSDEMTIALPGDVPMTFCWCPATTSEEWKRISGGDDFFWMGSPESEEERSDNEARHRVKLTQGFWMGKYEVTQRQWECVMGENPSAFKGADRPVEQVSWDDCQEFVGKINAPGRVWVSLPTEAQWEYACRSGTTTPFNFGSALNGDRANCDGSSPYGMVSGRCRLGTSPVGEYAPNAWGLYDMHGNVGEWCRDWFGDYAGDTTDPTGSASGTERVNRGGSWIIDAAACRSASRFGVSPGYGNRLFGFRLVCSAGLRR